MKLIIILFVLVVNASILIAINSHSRTEYISKCTEGILYVIFFLFSIFLVGGGVYYYYLIWG